MTAFTVSSMQNLPVGLRSMIGEHFANSRWKATCDYFNNLSERYRLTLCFHPQLKKRHSVFRLEEMDTEAGGNIVCAIDELRRAFSRRCKQGVNYSTFLSWLNLSERRTLFMHAGLPEAEFNQPYWRIDDESCQWRDKVIKAIDELVSLFDDAPEILTAVKPEDYLN